eukprot:gene14661-biopygen10049
MLRADWLAHILLSSRKAAGSRASDTAATIAVPHRSPTLRAAILASLAVWDVKLGKEFGHTRFALAHSEWAPQRGMGEWVAWKLDRMKIEAERGSHSNVCPVGHSKLNHQ